mmetsp:Transcript_22593/g.34071  ORF Transcript_22593/g.34071 Transcript_22593/m.34071 type:complete len:213 (+) Transcript_22593:299-937(+)
MMSFWVAKYSSRTAGGGSLANTSPPSTFTGKCDSERLGSSRPAPVRRSKVFLCSGQATLGASPAVPMMPSERTGARMCGQTFCVQYHSPRLAKLKTASWVSPQSTAAPPSSGKSSTVPTRSHWASAWMISGFMGTHSMALGQSAGRCCPLWGMFWMSSWLRSVLTNCRKRLRMAGSAAAVAHSFWYVSTTCCICASRSALICRWSSMTTFFR